jgi:two-component system response regulator FixJ
MMNPHSEVYVIDGDAPTQRSLTSLFQAAGFASRVYGDAFAFLDDCDRLPPGCIVASLRSPGMDGFELLRRLKERGGAYPAILTASDGGVSRAVESMKAGAVDFIERPYGDEVLLKAVCTALKAEEKSARLAASVRHSSNALATLTSREHDVLLGVLAGQTSKMIARDCGISPRTVEVHRANVMTKSGARSLPELVRIALLADRTGKVGALDAV